MAKKTSRIKRRALPRSLSVSLAGLRAGSALAVDTAVQRLMRRSADGEDSAFARREARRFVSELGKLKGTYVKIGQMLAMFGEHFLPPVLTEALHELEDRTGPLPWEAVEPAFRAALGDRFDELEIETAAIAAASLAQVHRARIRASGEWICLKVQYPGLSRVIDADFDAVVRMLLLARWLKAGRDLDDWLQSMRAHLHHEIDYGREARLTAEMAGRVAAVEVGSVSFYVPRLYPQYCSDTVLALEYIDGRSVNDPAVAALSLERRNALARGMLELFFFELYDWGMLQTDPNFGNYLLRLDDRRLRQGHDQLVLLDFGSVLECSQDFLLHLRNVIDAGQRQDVPAVVEGLVGLGCLQPDASEEGRQMFADFCLHLLEPLRPPEALPSEYLNARGDYCWANSRLMQRAGKQAALSTASRHFTPPSRDFALIARKLTGVFTFISVLRAEFNAHDMVQAHIDRWRREVTRGQEA
jgi:predicted unusual protein kinase regulating ubiquinone biosynthesis (AarF/ABC1/UbiB family)